MNAQQSNFSDLFYAIAEQIASQQNWMLGDAFTDILDLIDDDQHKQIVIIDHILSVFFFFFFKKKEIHFFIRFLFRVFLKSSPSSFPFLAYLEGTWC